MTRAQMRRRLIEEGIEPHAAFVYARLVGRWIDEERAREQEFAAAVRRSLDRIPVTMKEDGT